MAGYLTYAAEVDPPRRARRATDSSVACTCCTRTGRTSRTSRTRTATSPTRCSRTSQAATRSPRPVADRARLGGERTEETLARLGVRFEGRSSTRSTPRGSSPWCGWRSPRASSADATRAIGVRDRLCGAPAPAADRPGRLPYAGPARADDLAVADDGDDRRDPDPAHERGTPRQPRRDPARAGSGARLYPTAVLHAEVLTDRDVGPGGESTLADRRPAGHAHAARGAMRAGDRERPSCAAPGPRRDGAHGDVPRPPDPRAPGDHPERVLDSGANAG